MIGHGGRSTGLFMRGDRCRPTGRAHANLKYNTLSEPTPTTAHCTSILQNINGPFLLTPSLTFLDLYVTEEAAKGGL